MPTTTADVRWSDIIRRVARRTRYPRNIVGPILRGLVTEFSISMMANESVMLQGIGKFHPRVFRVKKRPHPSGRPIKSCCFGVALETARSLRDNLRSGITEVADEIEAKKKADQLHRIA